MSEPLVAAQDLSWRAGGRTILGPLDFSLAAGECRMVVGPNGAGKTTLLRLVTGLWTPATGELLWRGTRYRRLSRRELARRIAYVPQIRPARVPLTVEEVVLSGRYPHLSARRLAPAASDWQAVRQAIATVGIEALADRPLDELSGGERQAAYIAAALAQEPELLVLDEPTTHLDPRHQRDIALLLARLHEQGDRAVLVATHDLNFASLLADSVLALAGGKAVACGPPAEMLTPAVLSTLFEAPFATVRGGERPLHLLEIGE
jgi:iron complex transport system ATP-binding protein